ncbi:MAG TPA: alpha/beta hydrolase [Chloroflexota bacterium]|nr:alpha/beta hydrolase [Chloroflexota bacterium]
MPFVDLTGARLWFADSGGSGAPVVFVHPAATTSACWVHQVEAFTAAGYRCITYDLRGWGKSEMDAGAEVGTMSDDLEALVQSLGLRSFILIAAAYGGFGGVEYALRFPGRLRALVLATSQGGLVDPDYVSVLERVVSPPIRALPVHLRELGPSYRAENPQGVERWLQIADQSGEGNRRRQPRVLEITLPLLESLTAPTLLVAGAADLLAPPALMRLMAERIPSCVFATVAEAGHSAHWERAAEWNRIVLAFLRQH